MAKKGKLQKSPGGKKKSAAGPSLKAEAAPKTPAFPWAFAAPVCIVAALAILIIPSPFIIAKQALESFRTPQQTGFNIAFFLLIPAWLVHLFYASGSKIRVPKIGVWLLALTAASAISVVQAEIKPISIQELLFFIQSIGFFFILFQICRSRLEILSAIGLIVAVGYVVAGMAAGQYFFNLNEYWIGYKSFFDPFSTFGNKNYLCEYLAMILPMITAMFLASRSLGWRLFYVATGGFFFVIVLITQTRGGWLGLGVATLLMLVDIAIEGNRKKVMTVVGAAGVFLLIMAGVVFLQAKGVVFNRSSISFVKRFSSIMDPKERSHQARTIIWGTSWLAFLNEPLGAGVGQYKVVYLRHLQNYLKAKGIEKIPTPEFKDINAREAHNEYLNLLVELGPLGGAAMAGLIVQILLLYIRLHRKLTDPLDRTLAQGAFFSLTSIATSAMFGFPFHIVPTIMAAACFLAFLNHFHAKTEERPMEAAPRWLFNPAARAVLFALSAAGLVWGVNYGLNPLLASIDMKVANAMVDQAQTANRSGQTELAESLFGQAENLFGQSAKKDPYNGEIHTFYGTFLAQHRGRMDEAEKELLLAKKYNNLPHIHLHLGQIYLKNNQLDKAEAEFRETLGLFPDNSESRYLLGTIAEQKGNPEQALEYYRDAIAAAGPKAMNEYYFKAARLMQKLGKSEESVKVYDDVIRKYPNDVNSLYNLAVIFSTEFKDWIRAKELYARILELNPGHCESRNNLGNILNEEGDYQGALTQYATCLAHNPNYDQALSNLSGIYIRLGQFDKAVGKNEEILATDVSPRTRFHALFNLGLAHARMRDLDSALGWYQKACDAQPGSGLEPIHLLRCKLETARTLYDKGQWKACYDAGKPYEKHPDLALATAKQMRLDVDFRNVLGFCSLRVGDFAGAKANLDFVCGSLKNAAGGPEACNAAARAAQALAGGAP